MDPEFRSPSWAISNGCLTGLAVINSQEDALPEVDTAMPKWDWGVPGTPYKADG